MARTLTENLAVLIRNSSWVRSEVTRTAGSKLDVLEAVMPLCRSYKQAEDIVLSWQADVQYYGFNDSYRTKIELKDSKFYPTCQLALVDDKSYRAIDCLEVEQRAREVLANHRALEKNTGCKWVYFSSGKSFGVPSFRTVQKHSEPLIGQIKSHNIEPLVAPKETGEDIILLTLEQAIVVGSIKKLVDHKEPDLRNYRHITYESAAQVENGKLGEVQITTDDWVKFAPANAASLTGWKINFSIAPGDVEKAADILLPLALENKLVLKAATPVTAYQNSKPGGQQGKMLMLEDTIGHRASSAENFNWEKFLQAIETEFTNKGIKPGLSPHETKLGGSLYISYVNEQKKPDEKDFLAEVQLNATSKSHTKWADRASISPSL